MRLLDRYIGQAVQTGVVSVLAVFLVLVAVINYIGEYDKIGRADYTSWLAFQYVMLWMPRIAYQMFPLAALMGTMIGLGALSNHSELVVIRASGVSKLRIAMAVLKSMIALVVVIFLVGEVVAPPAEQYAEQMRIRAMESRVSINTEYGLWVRSGDTFIHVMAIDNDGKLRNVELAVTENHSKLLRTIHADSAQYDGDSWLLRNVEIHHISQQGVKKEHRDEMRWKGLLEPDIVETLTFNPESLSIWNLLDYVRYLENNGLDSSLYQLAMWTKILSPLTVMAMVLLAVPFMFRSQRSGGLGRQIILGFMIGIVFYIINRLVGQMGVIYNIPAVISASIPTMLVMATALLLYRRE